jgi:hypothetical protein
MFQLIGAKVAKPRTLPFYIIYHHSIIKYLWLEVDTKSMTKKSIELKNIALIGGNFFKRLLLELVVLLQLRV